MHTFGQDASSASTGQPAAFRARCARRHCVFGQGYQHDTKHVCRCCCCSMGMGARANAKELENSRTEERCTIRYPMQRSTRQTSQESMVASSSICLLVLASRGLWSASLQSRDFLLLPVQTKAQRQTQTLALTLKRRRQTGANELSKIGRQGAGNHHQDWTCAPSALNRAP